MKKKEAEMQKLFIKGYLMSTANVISEHIKEYLVGLGEVCHMNIFFGPVVKSPDSYDQETWERLGKRPPEDINGIVMWDDSGVQMYIFPSKDNWFTIDVYTCKKFDNKAVLDYTAKEFNIEHMEFSTQTSNTITPWQSYRELK